VLLDALPLAPDGKVDRTSLPEPDRERVETAATFRGPASDPERTIAARGSACLSEYVSDEQGRAAKGPQRGTPRAES